MYLQYFKLKKLMIESKQFAVNIVKTFYKADYYYLFMEHLKSLFLFLVCNYIKSCIVMNLMCYALKHRLIQMY